MLSASQWEQSGTNGPMGNAQQEIAMTCAPHIGCYHSKLFLVWLDFLTCCGNTPPTLGWRQIPSLPWVASNGGCALRGWLRQKGFVVRLDFESLLGPAFETLIAHLILFTSNFIGHM